MGAPVVSGLPYEIEVRCAGPEHCVDDLCVNSDVGLCGVPRREVDEWWDDERPEDDADVYAYEWPEDDE
jgi:hypothetical protein